MLTDTDLQTWHDLQMLPSLRQRVLESSAFLWRFYDVLQHADVAVLERAETTLSTLQQLEFASDPELLDAFLKVSIVCGKHATAARRFSQGQQYLEQALAYIPGNIASDFANHADATADTPTVDTSTVDTSTHEADASVMTSEAHDDNLRLACYIAVTLSLCWYVAARYRDIVDLTGTYLPLTRKWSDSLNEARLLNTRGVALRALGRYRPALEALQASYRLYAQLDHPELERPTGNLASFYNHLGQIEQSQHYFTHALALSRRYGLAFDEALVIAQMGDQQLEHECYDNALSYYQEAIPKLEAVKSYDTLAVILANAAIVYTHRGELDHADTHVQRALSLIHAHPRKRYHMVILYSLGLLQIARKDSSSCATLEDALSRAVDIEERRFQTMIHHALAHAYKQQGDLEKAFDHLSIYHQRHSEQLEQKRQRTIAGFTLEFAFEREQLARENAEYALKTQTELLERITDGFLAVDHQGIITYANHIIADLNQQHRSELVGKHISSYLPHIPADIFTDGKYEQDAADQPVEPSTDSSTDSSTDLSAEPPADFTADAQESQVLEVYFDSQQRWYDVRIYPNKLGTTVYLLDISERKSQDNALKAAHGQLEQAYAETAAKVRELEQLHLELKSKNHALERLSQQDGLTKLLNRRTLDSLLTQEFLRAKRYHTPLSVMLCDIDNFKYVNDTFSHALGDEVLRHVARIFSRNTRRQDIVARYGGEEFVIVFPETSLDAAVNACENLRERVANYAWYNIHPDLQVTLSMGLAIQHPTNKNHEAILKAADVQMYHAKTSGKNRLCFNTADSHETNQDAADIFKEKM